MNATPRWPLFILCMASFSFAQTPSAAPIVINTDRPAFADSSTVVPKDSLVIENGFLASTTGSSQTLDFPESQFRFGILDKTELRFSAPDYFDGPVSGAGDISAGIKQQLGPIYGFDVSLVLTLSFPTGAKHISSHG